MSKTEFKQSKLPNGVVVLTEAVPSAETVSVGVYVAAGSSNETAENNGVAHYLEHMAFKGTRRRTALDIAREVENVGGYTNAFTDRETTAYYLKMMPEDMGLGIDILSDILLNSTFEQEEMERERGVILQEIGMYQDNPSSAVYDVLQRTAFKDQPMGRDILGTVETVGQMNQNHLRGFIDTFYGSDTLVVSGSGVIDHDKFVTDLSKVFCDLNEKKPKVADMPKYIGGLALDKRDALEQAHIALAYEGPSYEDDDYYAARVWATALGSGMASPLFQEVREKRGLAYSADSFIDVYKKSGLFGVYAGTSPKDVSELMKVLKEELSKASDTLKEEELERAKTQMKAGIKMSLESSDSRMERIANGWLIYGREVPIEEVVAGIDSITMAQACGAGKRILSTPQTLAGVGPITAEDLQ